MEGRTTHLGRSHLFVKRCVACGFETRLVEHSETCVRCGCDLHERPPRSYAEMEGLTDQPLNLNVPQPTDLPLPTASSPDDERTRAFKRWMLFLLLTILLLLSIAALAAAALGA